MPAQKRKLSEADVDNSSKKQRYSSSLLFKPNVNLNTKKSATTIEPTNNQPPMVATNTTQQIQNEKISTAASYVLEPEDDLKVPKLSIKRKVNSDSQKSEFTIQSNLLVSAAPQKLVFNRQDSSNESATDSSGEENEDDDVNEEVDNDEGLSDDDLDEDEIEDNDEDVEEEDEEDEGEEEEEEGDFDEDSTGTDSNSSNDSNQNENSEAIDNRKTVSPIKISLKSNQNSKANKSSKEVEVTNESDNTKPERATKPRVTRKPKSDSSEDTGAKKKRGRPAKEKPPKVDKTPRSITSYYVYCQVTRPIIAQKHPELKLRQQYRIVADMWSKLTDKEKLIWRHKAIKLRKKGSKGMISTGAVAKQQQHQKQQQETRATVTPKPSVRTQQRTASAAADNATNKPLTAAVSTKTKSPKLEEKTEKPVQSASESQLPSNLVNFVQDTKPIDLASYMTLLGESLTLIGTRLREHEGKYAVQGSSIVLLDSLLCALGPLVGLTNQIEEMDGCPKEVLTNILENVSYIMPGL